MSGRQHRRGRCVSPPGRQAVPQTLNVGARSVFVTAVGWVFIVLAMMSVVWALVRFASAGSVSAAVPGPQGLTSHRRMKTEVDKSWACDLN